jgi:preprotein translocase subunit YajC
MISMLLLQDADAPAGPNMLIMMAGMIAIFFFVAIWPERKARKKKEALIAALRKNDKVLLTSGIYATVAAISDGELTVRFDDGNTRVRVLKSAIAQVVSQDDAGKDAAAS